MQGVIIHLIAVLPRRFSDLTESYRADTRASSCEAPSFGLAPSGVYHARHVTMPRCALTAPFTLTAQSTAVCFLWHFPSSHPDWPLTSTTSCGARTFLPRSCAGDHVSWSENLYFALFGHVTYASATTSSASTPCTGSKSMSLNTKIRRQFVQLSSVSMRMRRITVCGATAIWHARHVLSLTFATAMPSRPARTRSKRDKVGLSTTALSSSRRGLVHLNRLRLPGCSSRVPSRRRHVLLELFEVICFLLIISCRRLELLHQLEQLFAFCELFRRAVSSSLFRAVNSR